MEDKTLFELLFKKEIILYGSGVTGVETYKILSEHFHGINNIYFADNFKNGHLYDAPILDLNTVKDKIKRDEAIIIITALADNHRAIEDKLSSENISFKNVWSFKKFENIINNNIEDSRIDLTFKKIKKYKIKLSTDYEGPKLYLNWWCPEHYCNGDILVYQPGKVGSTTICNSLSNIGVNNTHVHMLTDYYIYNLIPELQWTPHNTQKKLIMKASEECIRRIKLNQNLKIITLIREPIIRDLSLLFYHYEYISNLYTQEKNDLFKNYNEGIRKRATQNRTSKYGYQYEWFNNELKKVFGIDVYKDNFDTKKGYSIIKKQNVEVLIIKLEKLNSLEKVIGDFIENNNFKLINSNQAKNKKYYNEYKYAIKSLDIEEDILNMYYTDNTYFNHFYNSQERKEFLNKWRRI